MPKEGRARIVVHAGVIPAEAAGLRAAAFINTPRN